jgi:hypothetical protein
MSDAIREAFEKWYWYADYTGDAHTRKYCDSTGRYQFNAMQSAWEAWQAALQSREQVTLERVEASIDHYYDDCRLVIEPDPEGSLVYYDNVVQVLQATPQPVVPEGYVLVPAEPTRAMLDAAIATPCAEDQDEDYVNMYKAMLSAGKETV